MPTTVSPPIQLLTAIWNLWQSLIAHGAARLRSECGLDLKEFIAAGYLQERSLHPATLAEEMQMPRYEVSRLLGSLEDKGFVQRTRDQADRRQVCVSLTPAGLAAWQRGIATAESVTSTYLTDLDKDELENLILTLASLTQP